MLDIRKKSAQLVLMLYAAEIHLSSGALQLHTLTACKVLGVRALVA
jgi:hypothetical protein